MRISDKSLVAPLLPGALTVGDLLELVEDSVCSPLGSDVGWLVAPLLLTVGDLLELVEDSAYRLHRSDVGWLIFTQAM